MNCVLLPVIKVNNKVNNIEANNNPPLPVQINHYHLTDHNKINHIRNVLKLGVGDRLKVGFRSGCLGTATIAIIDENSVDLVDIDCHQMPPKKLDLTIVLAICRPKVLRRLIMDMTAIGVNRIVLVNSYRSQKSYWQSPLLNRLDEFVEEGLQQGMDTVAPIIECHKRFKPFVEDVLSQWTASNQGVPDTTPNQAVVAHPYAKQSFDAFTDTSIKVSRQSNLPRIICIGAEGGWVDYEVELLQRQGVVPVHLGKRILRTEAVVNVLCGRYVCRFD